MNTHTNEYGTCFVLHSTIPLPESIEISMPQKEASHPFGRATCHRTASWIEVGNGGTTKLMRFDSTGNWSYGEGYGSLPPSATFEEARDAAARWAWARKEGYEVSFTAWWVVDTQLALPMED